LDDSVEPGIDPTADDFAAEAAPTSQERQPDYVDAAERLLRRCIDNASNNSARVERDRADHLNLLYERGGPDNQYVIFDQGTGRFVTRGHDPARGGLPEWMPRPVTPLYSNKIDGIVSQLNRADPAKVFAPATDDDEDLATADVADHAMPVLLDEINYSDAVRPDIHRSIVLTDKVALEVYYDNDPKHGSQDILAQQCDACLANMDAEESMFLPMDLPEEAPDTCPHCGGPLSPAVDPRTQAPIGLAYPKGKMSARLHSSFEFSLPTSARTHRAEENPWWLGHSRYSWEDAIAQWGSKIRTLRSRGAAHGSTGTVSRVLADAVRRLSSPRSSRDTGGGAKNDDGPVVYHLLHDPIEDEDFYFPEGLSAWMADDVLLDAGPLDYVDSDGKPFKNVLTRTFRATPGSPFGHPPADDMVPMQYQRNLLEALLMSILMHHASPREYIPLSVTLEKPPTGVPGEHIYFRSVVPGEHPIVAPGNNPPEGLYKWIDQIDQKFDEISKLNAVLQGERPQGDPTLGEIEILKEEGQSAFSEPYLELVRFERQLCRYLLWIARDTLWVERTHRVMGENGAWEVQQFTGADLQGRVDVQIDLASAWPKSTLMQKMNFKAALDIGAFQMMAMDPELGAKVLELYDLTEFKPSFDVDRQQIMRELDRWKAAVSPMEIAPPDPVLMNLPMHAHHKLQFLKTEECERLAAQNPPLFQAMKQHVQMIQQTLAMQAAAAAAAQNPQPPGKEEEQGDGGKTLESAIQSGALQPAGAGGDPLEQAMAQGALVPAGAAAAQQPSGPSIDDLIAQGAMQPAAPEGAEGMPRP
jgi:hypothetical protein